MSERPRDVHFLDIHDDTVYVADHEGHSTTFLYSDHGALSVDINSKSDDAEVRVSIDGEPLSTTSQHRPIRQLIILTGDDRLAAAIQDIAEQLVLPYRRAHHPAAYTLAVLDPTPLLVGIDLAPQVADFAADHVMSWHHFPPSVHIALLTADIGPLHQMAARQIRAGSIFTPTDAEITAWMREHLPCHTCGSDPCPDWVAA